MELFHGWRFSQAVAHLRQQAGVGNVLLDTARYYQNHLGRSPEAVAYLHQRGVREPAVMEQMRIGYAPGRCLRSWLESLGYPKTYLRDTGLLTAAGTDTFSRRIIFPLEGNLYGRSIGWAAPHRFLPQRRGGLYDWARLRQQHDVILVEGLFDVAAMRSAGFWNTNCSLGTHLNLQQWEQLCGPGERTIYNAFDGDDSGQQASWQLAMRCTRRGVRTRRVELPQGQDPNGWLAMGATAGMSVSGWRTRDDYPMQGTGGDVLVCPKQPWPEAVLVEYILWQGKQPRRPAPATIQSRLAAVRQWMAFQCGLITPSAGRRNSRFSRPGWRATPERLWRVSVKVPRRQTVPLSQDEVSRFWASFRSLRDLAVVGLTLLNGLRAGEVLGLEREDVLLGRGELRVRGKGRRLRLLPLAPETIQLLDYYLRSERPTNSGSH
ncbi:MAG: toprim domain-containing protein [Bryobacterales bacterium]|nr:toprim domain-containing protein [Bryobacterales bacterium]